MCNKQILKTGGKNQTNTRSVNVRQHDDEDKKIEGMVVCSNTMAHSDADWTLPGNWLTRQHCKKPGYDPTASSSYEKMKWNAKYRRLWRNSRHEEQHHLEIVATPTAVCDWSGHLPWGSGHAYPSMWLLRPQVYLEVVATATGRCSSALAIKAVNHVNQIDVWIFPPCLHVTPCLLNAVLILRVQTQYVTTKLVITWLNYGEKEPHQCDAV